MVAKPAGPAGADKEKQIETVRDEQGQASALLPQDRNALSLESYVGFLVAQNLVAQSPQHWQAGCLPKRGVVALLGLLDDAL